MMPGNHWIRTLSKRECCMIFSISIVLGQEVFNKQERLLRIYYIALFCQFYNKNMYNACV